MNFALDDEQQLVVSTVRRFADKELAGWAADADRDGAPPDRLADLGADVGFFVDAVPADADGLLEGDYDHLTRALRSIELGRGCAALAALLECNVEPALAVGRWGSDAARAALFGALGGGALATTARDFAGALEVTAKDDGLVVSGKLGPLPALAGASHVLLVLDQADEPAVALLSTDGLEVEAIAPSGWRAARWGTLTLDGAAIAADHVLARGDAARAAIEVILAWYRTGLAARAVGVATAAIAHAAHYGTERIQFGQPIGTFESLAGMRDDNETAIGAARAYTLEAAWKVTHATADAGDAASRARDFAARTLAKAAIDAVQMYGGYGFVNDYPVEKLMRDARAFEVLCGNEALDRVLARRHDGGAN